MRLIDERELIRRISELPDLRTINTGTIGKIIKECTTIDAEPVVRCKDCQHWGTGYGGETDNIKVCEYANYMVGKNGYCVYGERKMDLEVKE